MATSSPTSISAKTTDENLRSIKKRLLDELTVAIEDKFLVRVTRRAAKQLTIQPWRDNALILEADVSRWDDDQDVIDMGLAITEKHFPRYEEEFTAVKTVDGWVAWPMQNAYSAACDEWGTTVNEAMAKVVAQACEQFKVWLTGHDCAHLIR